MNYVSPAQRALWKEYQRQLDAALAQRARELLWWAGSPIKARKLLAAAIEADEARRKRLIGRPTKVNGFVLVLAAAIKQREGCTKRAALRTALASCQVEVTKKTIRRYEDVIRKQSLADFAEAFPLKLADTKTRS
jgi:hypothetical protein